MKGTHAIRWLAMSIVLAFSAGARASDDWQPFHHMFTIVLNEGVRVGNANLAVPAGKRLMIEHVSIVAHVPAKSGQNVVAAVRTRVGGQEASHFLAAASSVGTWGGMDALVGSHGARVYADGGTQFGIGLERTVSTAGQASIRVTVSGRMIEP